MSPLQPLPLPAEPGWAVDAETRLDSGLIEGQARVVAVDAEHAWLQAEAPAACGPCASRSACGSGTAAPQALAHRTWRAPRDLARVHAQAGGLADAAGPSLDPLASSGHHDLLALGDAVRIGVPRAAVHRAAATAYSLPLMGLLGGAVAGQPAGDRVALAASATGLLLGAVLAWRVLRRWRPDLQPVVLGRVEAATAAGCAPHGAGPVLDRGVAPNAESGPARGTAAPRATAAPTVAVPLAAVRRLQGGGR